MVAFGFRVWCGVEKLHMVEDSQTQARSSCSRRSTHHLQRAAIDARTFLGHHAQHFPLVDLIILNRLK